MPDRNAITESVFHAIDEMNQLLPENERISRTVETALYGNGSNLDSLKLVRLIVAVEQSLEADLGVRITLASEKAFSTNNSPFRTIDSLIDFIATLATQAHG
jgi:acyl carrier protein